MPRPRKHRRCRRYRADRVYKPQGIPMRDLATAELTLDQFEAMRLCDLEGLDQLAAGKQLGVSRGTVQRLLWEGRRRLIGGILNNYAITVTLKQGED